MRRIWIIVSLLLVCALSQAQEGKRAPDFTVKNLDGQSVQLKDYLGKNPILIDFWATWCVPCKEEMPHLEEIYKEYKDKGLVYFAISEDSPRSISKVKPYVKSKKYDATVLLDPDGSVLRKFFGSNTLPYTVIIDREGKISRTFTGYVPGQQKDIREIIEKIVAPAEPPAQPQ
ncbi:MAG: TlpA disulfide reductase family protein [bacterium]|nr:TlpA disulfide reductase family protein [bacterium]